METEKVRDLSTAQSPKATDFVMLITNLTTNVLEKCQLSALREVLTNNNISDDEGNGLTLGSDDKLYVASQTEEIGIIESNVTNLNNEVNTISNDVSELKTNVEELQGISIIDKWQQGSEGYRIWNDGYCEQWGITAGGQNETVNLIKTYKDTDYVANYVHYTDVSGDMGQLIFDRTANSFNLVRKANGAITQKAWTVKGYLAEGEY